MWDKIPKGKPLKPSEFFRFNRGAIEIIDTSKWLLKLDCGTFEHPIHYNVESLATSWTWLAPHDRKIVYNNGGTVNE